MDTNKALDRTLQFRFEKADFAEFSAVNYRHNLRTSVYILLLYIIFELYYIFRYGFIPVNPVFHLACLIFTVIVFYVNSSRMKTATEKEVSHWNNPYREYVITFGEHICVNRDGAEKRYALTEVKKIFKAGSLYCLYLRQKSYIIVKADGDFPEFLFSKCEKISPKRVLDLEKTKKTNKIVFIATLALMALHFAILVVAI